jgi:uncharacterized FlaG/YvyC family protein
MSFDISSVQGSNGTVASVRATGRATPASTSHGTTSTEAVKVDVRAIPENPPPEVLDAMATAAAAHEQLANGGRNLSFRIDEATGRVIVTVHDAEGKALFTVPGSKALDVASGGSLDH